MQKSLKSKALYFLARREYSFRELYSKLQRYTDDNNEIKEILLDMQKKGWLSDERYINNFITFKSNRYGLIKIRNELIKKTENKDLVNKIINNANVNEFENAYNLWLKKFGVKAINLIDKQKQMRYLYNKGFSFNIINKIISDVEENFEFE